MTDKIIFALKPGKVISKYDGDEHYINVQQLVSSYNVPLKNCAVVENKMTEEVARKRGLIILEPDPTGEYALPVKKSKELYCQLCGANAGFSSTITTEGCFCEPCLKIVIMNRKRPPFRPPPWYDNG